MELYLLRHGDAVDRLTGGYAQDEDRPLTERGQTEAITAATALMRLHGTIDQIFTSPLVRTRQTAQVVADHLQPAPPIAISAALAPGGNHAALYQTLSEQPAQTAILLVGHMPDVGEIAGWLIWSDPQATLPFRTGGLCRITLSAIAAGAGDLRWLAPPKLLRQIGAKK